MDALIWEKDIHSERSSMDALSWNKGAAAGILETASR
jgi:hypothetical protein